MRQISTAHATDPTTQYLRVVHHFATTLTVGFLGQCVLCLNHHREIPTLFMGLDFYLELSRKSYLTTVTACLIFIIRSN